MVFRFSWPIYHKDKCCTEYRRSLADIDEIVIMTSRDSLNYIENEERRNGSPKGGSLITHHHHHQHHHVDTLQQGAEMQDSPRGGSVNSSVSSSSPVRHEPTTPLPLHTQSAASINMPQYCTTNTATSIASHQLLVDPATGQHYLVPSAGTVPAPPPPTAAAGATQSPAQHAAQIFYQPIYYSPAPAQPLYYQPFTTGAQGAYIMAQPIASTQGGAVPILPPQTLAQRFSGSPPAASLPGGYAQSIVDSEDIRSLPVGEDHHSFLQHRLKMQKEALRASEISTQRLIQKKSQSPPSSPPYTPGGATTTTTTQQQQQHSTIFMQSFGSTNLHKPLLSRQDGSSQTVSTPPRTEPRPDHLVISSSSSSQRTPLFGGAPSWWGDDQQLAAAASAHGNDEQHAHTDIESNREQQQQQQHSPSSGSGVNFRKTFKPVRMDIDLNKPFEDEETPKKEQKPKAVRAPPTAFTVSFDTNEDGKANLSLQDAARKSTTRRLLRRSAPSSSAAATLAAMTAAGLHDSTDPKQYLLNKMLMGSGPSAAAGFNGAPEFTGASGADSEKREFDTLSEAGTYVVDEKDRQLDQMVTSQHNDSDDDDDSDSGSSTTSTTTTTTNRRSASPRSNTDPSQIRTRIVDLSRKSQEMSAKNETLLRELLRLGTGGDRDRQGSSAAQNAAAAAAAAVADTQNTTTTRPQSTVITTTTTTTASAIIRPCKVVTSAAATVAAAASAVTSSTAAASAAKPQQRSGGGGGGGRGLSPSKFFTGRREISSTKITTTLGSSPSASASSAAINSRLATNMMPNKTSNGGGGGGGGGGILPSRVATAPAAAATISATTTTTPTAPTAPTTTTTTTPNTTRLSHHSQAHAHCFTPSPSSMNCSTSTSTSSNHIPTAGTNFRRGDGGRFSMRTASSSGGGGGQSSIRSAGGGQQHQHQQQSTRNTVTRPPFRVGASSRATTGYGSSSAPKESAEMTAWLRRKDYNPMKAAAEARKLQQLKVRSDQFTSNRSISFHQGARVDPSSAFVSSEMTKSRCNRSQDDLLNEGECGPETILASYSKGISRDLNRLKLVEGSSNKKTQIGELEKSVQQLALKCNRSIELIRNAHQGHLSESVESLLERAVQPTNVRTNSVTDQLDRLSAAFDAIQKYLEVSSTPTSVPSSPSAASSSSPVRCCPSSSSNCSSPTRQRSSVFKSKLVITPQRSPSGERVTPNNC